MKSAVLALNLGTILGSGENINLYYLVYSNTYLIIMAEDRNRVQECLYSIKKRSQNYLLSN